MLIAFWMRNWFRRIFWTQILLLNYYGNSSYTCPLLSRCTLSKVTRTYLHMLPSFYSVWNLQWFLHYLQYNFQEFYFLKLVSTNPIICPLKKNIHYVNASYLLLLLLLRIEISMYINSIIGTIGTLQGLANRISRCSSPSLGRQCK